MKIGEQRKRYSKIEIKRAFEGPCTFKVDVNIVFTDQQTKQLVCIPIKARKKIG